MTPDPRKPTEQQIMRAASELASQERYNPAWCKPGVFAMETSDRDLYMRRAALILKAALDG